MQEKTTAENPIVDFGKAFTEGMKQGLTANPAMIAQTFSNIKKNNPSASFEFSEDSQKQFETQFGKEAADQAKNLYKETIELMSVTDQYNLFQSGALDTNENRDAGYSLMKAKELIPAPKNQVFESVQFGKSFQHKTYMEASEENKKYYEVDSEGVFQEKSLKDSEDYGDIANPFGVGFGGSNLVVATNKWMSQFKPEIAEKIANKEIDEDSYYLDEGGEYSYRKLAENESNFDSVRSILGPRSIYNDGLLSEATQSLYDGVLGLAEGAGTVKYAAHKYLLFGGKKADESYNEFLNDMARFKTAGTMEEDLGWSYNLTNFTKLVSNGIGQIIGTMGAGYAIGGALKGISALSAASKVGAISPGLISNVAGASTRALNFGIAAKAGKEESMRSGLSVAESDLMGLISGAIMIGTEFMTGSQFIPKMVGKENFKNISSKITQDIVKKAEIQGISLGKLIEKEPNLIKNSIYKAHQWLEADAKNMASGFTKGFLGESIQETTEDFSFSMAKEGYDYLSGEKSFNQDWDNVGHDLMGSFLAGGFSGGVAKSFTSKSKKTYENDEIDEKKNSLIVNEIVKGNTIELDKAVDHWVKKGIASQLVSINRDQNGRKQLLAEDKSMNAMSENEFFGKMMKEQIKFAKTAYDVMRNKTQNKQKLADMIYESMGQTSFDQMSLADVAKGVSQAIEVEGMQVFRQESLMSGHLILEAAKSKTGVGVSLDHLVEARIFGNKVLAVKREGEAEFSAPTIEEETALQVANQELFFGGKLGQGIFEKASVITKARALENEIQFRVNRLEKGNPDPVLLAEAQSELEEARKETEKVEKELKEDLEKKNLSTTMMDTLTDLDFLKGLKQSYFDGSRTKRYVRNFSLNSRKSDFAEIFKSRPDYNIEDYDQDKKRNEYFNLSEEMSNETFLKAAELTDSYLDEAIATEDVDTALSVINDILDQDEKVITDPIKQKIEQFFEDYQSAFNSGDIEARLKDIVPVLGLILEMAEDPGKYTNDMNTGGLDSAIETMKVDFNIALPKIKKIDFNIFGSAVAKVKQDWSAVLTPEDILFLDKSLGDFTDAKVMLLSAEVLKKREAIKTRLKDKQVFKQDTGFGDPVMDFIKNQNKAFADNLILGISGIKNKIDKLNTIEDFKDRGEISDLIDEINSNEQYLVGLYTEALDQKNLLLSKKALEGFEILKGYRQGLDELNTKSDKNKGNRFTRDFEVSMAYVQTRHEYLSQLNSVLGLGIEKELSGIDLSVLPTDETKDEVHDELEKIIKLEDMVAEKFAKLSEADILKVYTAFGFPVVEKMPGGLEGQLFRSVNHDNDSPWNPSPERDIAENKMNFLLMLSRGNSSDFWTFGQDYFKSIKIDQVDIPSREQLLIARQLFSKLATEKKSNLELFLEKKFPFKQTAKDKKGISYQVGISFSANSILLRGIGGAGKSTMVMKVLFDVLGRSKKSVSKELRLVYSAPLDTQIQNLAPSFQGLPDGTEAKSFKMENKNLIYENILKGELAKVNVIVVDEATMGTSGLIAIYEAVHKWNSKGKDQVKIMLAGDDLQSSRTLAENSLYTKTFQNAMERTIPLTTPFRSGKVDSFEIQMAHRKASIHLSILESLPEGTEFVIPVLNERIKVTDANRAEIGRKIISALKPVKKTRYTFKNNLPEKGVLSVSTEEQVIAYFIADVLASPEAEIKNRVLIVSDTDLVRVKDLVLKEIKASGKLIDLSMISGLVKMPYETQGLTIPKVYTTITIKDSFNSSQNLSTMKALYVAESREKELLVLLNPSQDISSERVTLESEIISFPSIKYDKNDQDGLAQILNNEHIASLVENLAVKKAVIPPSKLVAKAEKKVDKPKDAEEKKPDEKPLTKEKRKDTMNEKGKEAVKKSVNSGSIADVDRSVSRPLAEIEKHAEEIKKNGGYKFENICN